MTLSFHIKVSDEHADGADFVDAIFLYNRMLDILKESHEDILKEITSVNFSWRARLLENLSMQTVRL